MKNICVKVLSEEHGVKVLKAFEVLGIDVSKFDGSKVGRYYGIFYGKFGYNEILNDSTVITLKELQAMAETTFKRGERVLVWNGDSKVKEDLIFLAHIPGLFHPYYVVIGREEENFTKFEAGEKVDFCIQNYTHCEKIQPLPTIKDLCNKTKLTKDQLKKNHKQ